MKALYTLARILLSLIPIIVFSTLMLLFNSVETYLSELQRIGIWILLINVAYALQVNLFIYAKKFQLRVMNSKVVNANMATSTGSMVLCCLHHFVEVIPFLGITAFSVYLVKYQEYLLAMALISNFVGIYLMLKSIKKFEIYSDNTILSLIKNITYNRLKAFFLYLSCFVIVIVIFTA